MDGNAFTDAKVAESVANQESADDRDFHRGLALLGLMPPGDDPERTVREYWNWVGAFYSDDTKKITVLNRGHAVDTPSWVILLLHEMIHAMQFADPGVASRARRTSTFDEDLALSGMVEGEATLYEDLARLDAYGRDLHEPDWDAVFRGFQAREWADARKNPSPYDFAPHRFAYAFGGAYLNRAWRETSSGIERVTFIPTSTREILAGYGAHAPGGSPWKEDPNDVGTPLLPPAWDAVATVHLGTWLFEIWRDLMGNVPRAAFDGYVDSGFAGDVLSVFRLPTTGDVVSVWRLRFGSTAEATAVLDSVAGDISTIRYVEDRDLIVIVSTLSDLPPGIDDTLKWVSSPATDSTGAGMTASPRSGRRAPLVCPRPTE